MLDMIEKIYIFALTVRVALPVRTVSKDASFAFKPYAFQHLVVRLFYF